MNTTPEYPAKSGTVPVGTILTAGEIMIRASPLKILLRYAAAWADDSFGLVRMIAERQAGNSSQATLRGSMPNGTRRAVRTQ